MTDEAPAPAPAEAAPAPTKKRGRPRKARGASTTPDDSDMRWTVRGVPVNVRAMAMKAAEARNLTLGDFLSEAIVAAAREPVSGVPAMTVPALAQLVQTMNERLERMEQERGKGFLARIFGN